MSLINFYIHGDRLSSCALLDHSSFVVIVLYIITVNKTRSGTFKWLLKKPEMRIMLTSMNTTMQFLLKCLDWIKDETLRNHSVIYSYTECTSFLSSEGTNLFCFGLP